MRRMTNKQLAVKLFNEWRDAGYPMRITTGQAYEITYGLVGEKGGTDEMVSLAAVAVRYANRKAK